MEDRDLLRWTKWDRPFQACVTQFFGFHLLLSLRMACSSTTKTTQRPQWAECFSTLRTYSSRTLLKYA